MLKLLFSNHAIFANIASGIQSLVFTISIVIGGWWTMHTFGAVWSAELATFNAKEAADREDALEFSVRADAVTTYTREMDRNKKEVLRPRKIIIACLDIMNVGTRTQQIQLNAASTLIIEHLYQTNGDPPFYTDPTWGLQGGSSLRVAPKTKSTKCFDHPIHFPGLYSIRFEVPAMAVGNTLESPDVVSQRTTAFYQANTYLNVSHERGVEN